MPDPAWPASPPEVNYLRLAGPGAAGTTSTLASAAAWQALAATDEVAATASTANTAITALDFQGAGGVGSAAAAGRLNSSLQLLAGWVQAKPPVAASAVSAYETAISSMIPAEVSAANRTEHAANVAMNPLVFGALTPVIVALDATYFGEYWPHNAAVGVAYGAALSGLAATLAVPPPISPPGPLAAGPAAAAALAQSAGRVASSEALTQSADAATAAGEIGTAPVDAVVGPMASALTQPMQAAGSIQQPLLGMFGLPMTAFQGLSQLPQSWSAATGAGFGPGRDRLTQLDSVLPGDHGMSAVTAAVGAAGAATAGAGPAGGVVSAGAGGGAVPGLTTYTRPSAAFEAPGAARPGGLKPGLLNAAELRGPTSTGMASGPLPFAAGNAGASGQSRNDDRPEARARVVTGKGVRTADPA